MPELPEVETIRRQLSRLMKNKTIKEVKVRFGKRIEPRRGFEKKLEGKKIIGVVRRAKLLTIKFSGGLNLVVHLKMTGKMLFKKGGAEPSKHTHVIFYLSGGDELHWEDVRKFGYLKLLTDEEVKVMYEKLDYGPEPLTKAFDWKRMAECLRRRPNSTIKPLLMNPSCIAGIGNIYAVEALWKTKIHPLTRAGQISDVQMRKLHDNVISILKKAVSSGGTSSDDYLDAHGKKGSFASELKVYGRDGKACTRCRTKLKKIRVGGRGTVICEKCQVKNA